MHKYLSTDINLLLQIYLLSEAKYVKKEFDEINKLTSIFSIPESKSRDIWLAPPFRDPTFKQNWLIRYLDAKVKILF